MNYGDVTKCRKLQRILEILHDYWIDEPEEEYAEVAMYFRKSNGEEQEKVIIWRKPSDYEEKEYDITVKKISELEKNYEGHFGRSGSD